MTLPGIYHGRDRTFFYGQFRASARCWAPRRCFRCPPRLNAREWTPRLFRATPFSCRSIPRSAPILAGYPLPNDSQGAFGPRTYATSTKVAPTPISFPSASTIAFPTRASFLHVSTSNNTNGPITNPDQSAVEPGFAEYFHDHQRDAALRYTRTASPHLPPKPHWATSAARRSSCLRTRPSPPLSSPTACMNRSIQRRE